MAYLPGLACDALASAETNKARVRGLCLVRSLVELASREVAAHGRRLTSCCLAANSRQTQNATGAAGRALCDV